MQPKFIGGRFEASPPFFYKYVFSTFFTIDFIFLTAFKKFVCLCLPLQYVEYILLCISYLGNILAWAIISNTEVFPEL